MKKQQKYKYKLTQDGVKVFMLLWAHTHSAKKSSMILRKYYRGVAYEQVMC